LSIWASPSERLNSLGSRGLRPNLLGALHPPLALREDSGRRLPSFSADAMCLAARALASLLHLLHWRNLAGAEEHRFHRPVIAHREIEGNRTAVSRQNPRPIRIAEWLWHATIRFT
jgi:hypothetical protein